MLLQSEADCELLHVQLQPQLQNNTPRLVQKKAVGVEGAVLVCTVKAGEGTTAWPVLQICWGDPTLFKEASVDDLKFPMLGHALSLPFPAIC